MSTKIATTEALDELPIGSVVRRAPEDADRSELEDGSWVQGAVAELRLTADGTPAWFAVGDHVGFRSHQADLVPCTVLYRPDAPAPAEGDREALAQIVGQRVGWGQHALALVEDLQEAGFVRSPELGPSMSADPDGILLRFAHVVGDLAAARDFIDVSIDLAKAGFTTRDLQWLLKGAWRLAAPYSGLLAPAPDRQADLEAAARSLGNSTAWSYDQALTLVTAIASTPATTTTTVEDAEKVIHEVECGCAYDGEHTYTELDRRRRLAEHWVAALNSQPRP